ncbi:MAG: hypothetical protein KF813_07845 [Trueperaceae bacterium]|nr:hypothetical protein [Trueperaceae bacterium]
MSRSYLRLLAPLLVVLVVAACSQPAEPQPTGPQGTVRNVPGGQVMLGVGLLLMDFDDMGTPVSMSVTEFEEGVYLGPVAPVGEDRGFTLTLPDGTELPSALMTDADAFVYNVNEFAGCSLNASNATVQVTKAAWSLITVPGVAVLSIDGLEPAIATNKRMPAAPDSDDLADLYWQTWVYATGATNVSTSPAVCTSASDASVSVNVSLASGWNQLEWRLTVDGDGNLDSLSLVNSSADELHVAPISFLITSVH